VPWVVNIDQKVDRSNGRGACADFLMDLLNLKYAISFLLRDVNFKICYLLAIFNLTIANAIVHFIRLDLFSILFIPINNSFLFQSSRKSVYINICFDQY